MVTNISKNGVFDPILGRFLGGDMPIWSPKTPPLDHLDGLDSVFW